MNLFDMFRDSGSNEEVFSSVLTYLLDRFETHGLGTLIRDRVMDALPNEDAGSLQATFHPGERGQTFDSVLRDLLQDDMTVRIPPVSTEIRWVLKSLINTIHNNFTREQDVYGQARFPDRKAFLGRLPTVHRLLFEYLEEKSGGRRNVSTRNTSISFPGPGTDTLFRVLTLKNFRQTAAEIIETDYADTLIMELDETTWALDDTMKDTLAAIFKGTAHVAFHQSHPNGRNDEKATWILFGEGIDTETLPRVKTQIDKFWVLAEERFRACQESTG
ncbi:MAG: hypothetical protein PF508_16460 [Spirochaeta sp.]|jgi:hypothetical protein|nr:hypothetical protein [Spirochaeta sp.]